MSRGPLVSVVIPVFNGAPYVAESLESVLAQTYDEIEYVVCENHSSDSTAEIVDHYARGDSRLRVVSPPTFLSQTANSNYAIGHAHPEAKYVKIVHADDTIEATCVAKMVAIAEEHGTVGMVGARRLVGSDTVDLVGVPPTALLVPGVWLIGAQMLGLPYTTGPPTATMLRADILRRLPGPYDESYVHADDALSYRILLESDFGYVPETLTFTRVHHGAATTWAQRVGTWLPEHLRMTLEFGHGVLSQAEFEAIAGRLEREYIWQLVRHSLRLKLLRQADARRFHRRALASLEGPYRSSGRDVPLVLRPFVRGRADSARP